MNQYKKKGYQIVRLCLYQFGMTLFGLVVAMATVSYKPLFIGAGVFSAIFYLYLIYTLVYELGQQDGIRIEAGKRKYQPLTGLWLSLAANSLNILLGILAFIGKTVMDTKAVDPEWAVQLYGTANAIGKFIQGMYTAVLTLIMDESYALLLTPIPAIIVCTLAYILGVKFCHGVRKPKPKEDRYAPKISKPSKKI